MLYASVGANMTGSYSKIIHEALGYPWELLSLKPEEVERLLKSREFGGLSITIPYKKMVIPFCDKVSDLAKKIGAVNAIYFDDDGNMCGTNTDYEGFLFAMDTAGIKISGKKAVILGDGATCGTIRQALSDRGIKEIIVASRNVEKPYIKEENGIRRMMIGYDNLKDHSDADIIINATPVGMYPNTGVKLIDLTDFKNCSGVFDVIYNPYRTELVKQADSLGIPASGGLCMLVAQATAAANYFMHRPGFYDKENRRIIDMLRSEYISEE